MKIIVKIAVLLSLVASVQLNAQGSDEDKEKVPFKERLVFGGDVVLSFSNNFTAIGGTPLIGYRVSDRYVVGLGYTYIYQGNDAVSINYHGPRVFNRFFPIPELFAHAEFEYLSITEKIDTGREEAVFKTSFPALLVGGGYRQQVADGVFVSFMALYDIIEDRNSFYNGIVIRGGVGVGF